MRLSINVRNQLSVRSLSIPLEHSGGEGASIKGRGCRMQKSLLGEIGSPLLNSSPTKNCHLRSFRLSVLMAKPIYLPEVTSSMCLPDRITQCTHKTSNSKKEKKILIKVIKLSFLYTEKERRKNKIISFLKCPGGVQVLQRRSGKGRAENWYIEASINSAIHLQICN